jgi:hypothetical protein
MCTSFSKEMKSWNCPIRAAQYEDVLQLVAEMMGPDTSGDEEVEIALPQPVSVGMDAQSTNAALNRLPTTVVAEVVSASGPTRREQAEPR